jgi:hypothetical protein
MGLQQPKNYMKTETTEEPNIRWERIKEIASKYGNDLPLSEKVILLQFLLEDIKSHREILAKQLASIDEILGNESPHGIIIMGNESAHGKRSTMAPRARPAKKRGRVTGGMTTSDAIITALQSDGEMDIPTIRGKVEELKGKVSNASLNGSLMKLVKSKAIKNVSRGHYKRA